MAEILVAMKPGELGHLHCSFSLMRDVQKRGHSVTYIALSQDEEIIRRMGFNFRSLLPTRQPNDLKCDLFVADQTLPMATLQALYHGYQSIILSTTLPLLQEYPPSWSTRIPTRSFSSGLIRKAEGAVDAMLVRPARVLHDLRTSKHNPWNIKGKDMSLDGRYISVLKQLKSLPMLIASPPEFQFNLGATQATKKNHIFIGPCVDYERILEHFDCEIYRRSSVKICAALGSHATMLGARVSILLIELLRRRSDWSMVLSTSGSVTEDELGRIPGNVFASNTVPQMAALSQSDILITHCGLNSVKEAVSVGVPMVGIPFRRDQPSISARIRHHGLGMIANPRAIDSRKLEALIERTLASTEIRRNVERMQAIFRQSAEMQIGASIIDQMIKRKGAAR